MGVTIVGLCSVPVDKTSQQVLDTLIKRLQNRYAEKVDVWSLDFEYYQGSDLSASKKMVYSLVWSDCSTKYILCNNEDGQIIPMDPSDEFTNNIKEYNLRKSSKVHGQTLCLGDFIVKLSSAGTSFTDIILEVDYKPCYRIERCWNLMCEFCNMLAGSCEISLPETPYPDLAEDIVFEKSHTAVQYADILFNYVNYKKTNSKS